MKIKMPIRFFGNYLVTVRSGSNESKEKCQKLTMVPMSSDPQGGRSEDRDAGGTYQVIFHDAGCRRIIVGELKENREDRVVFVVDDKEYEFSPL